MPAADDYTAEAEAEAANNAVYAAAFAVQMAGTNSQKVYGIC